MYAVLTILSVYAAVQFNNIHKNVSQNTVQTQENRVLLQENFILTKAIQQEQQNRTENVYTVPYLKTKLEVASPNLKAGILKVDIRGNIMEASPGMYSILSMDKDELDDQALLGKSIAMLMSKESWARHQEILSTKDFGEDVLMNRVVNLKDKRVKVSASYLKTEKVFIINMKEI